jgi:hypothetical protein
MKSYFILFSIYTVFTVNPNSVRGSESNNSGYISVPYDSIISGEYRAVRYTYKDTLGQAVDFQTGISVYKRDMKLISISEDINEMVNLCSDLFSYPVLPYIHNDCYFHDINKDGLSEMVITDGWAGGSCCEGGLKLYSIDDTAKLLIEMTPTIAGFYAFDIENDSIPEFITWDDTYTSFLDYPYRAFIQRLIWKWDGTKYRIANGKFEDYLLNELGPNKMPLQNYLDEPDSIQIHSNQFIEVPSYYFWDMVLGYYFVGKPQVGDSLFNVYWRPEMPGKEKYWQELHKRIKADTLWPQILQSNW